MLCYRVVVVAVCSGVKAKDSDPGIYTFPGTKKNEVKLGRGCPDVPG